MGVHKYVVAGYFTSWGIYHDYGVSKVDASKLTHILYAFANLRENGEVFFQNPKVDVGNLRQLGQLKKYHRHLKVSLSIGGYNWSENFSGVAADPAKRETFVVSSITLLKNLGLDGLDINWEFPKDHQDAMNFVKLLRVLRHFLDDYAKSKNYNKYLLTASVPCSKDICQIMQLDEMNEFLDFFYLMAYNYAGKWSPLVGHQSNLYGGKVSTNEAVEYFLKMDISSKKIVIGIPLFGRAFENTNGIDHKFDGVGEGTRIEGIHDYKQLPRPGAIEYFDEEVVASWSFDPQTRVLISYDIPHVVELKCNYIRENYLGGLMFWELSADHPTNHRRSLVSAAYHGLGEDGMDESQKYYNIRNGYQ